MGSLFLCTLRVLVPLSRIELKLQTTEGKGGTLQLFVIPNSTPRGSHRCVIPIKPLSLHERIPQLSSEELQRFFFTNLFILQFQAF